VVGYRLLPRPLFNVHQARRRVKALASRTVGAHHRYVSGKTLEPGEREIHRVRLRSVGVYAVEHEARVAFHPVCIVTDRRVMAQDDRGHLVQIRRDDVRAVHLHRETDPQGSASFYLAIERRGSNVHDVRGDIALYCRNRQECEALASSIR
jgi:hypothetical protein